MNLRFVRIIAWCLALCAGWAQAARAQGVSLSAGLDALARSSNGLVGLTSTGALVRSTDNGATFSQVRAADTPTRALYGLAASGAVVLALGDAGVFVRSADGGQTFGTIGQAITPAFVGVVKAAAAGPSGQWVAVGRKSNRPFVMRSTNGGVAWAEVTLPSLVGELKAVAWDASSTRWIAVGGDGVFGLMLTSLNGTTWTAAVPSPDYPLNAIVSNGTGGVLAAGEAGTLLYSSNGGASFADAGSGIVSENLQSVAYVGSGQWVIGGDASALVGYNAAGGASGASIIRTPSGADSVHAIVSGTSAGTYYYASLAGTTTPPVSSATPVLRITRLAGQLRLTLDGAQAGVSYYLESSSNLTGAWTSVSGSNRTYVEPTAPVWDYAPPAAGARVFYRAKQGTLP